MTTQKSASPARSASSGPRPSRRLLRGRTRLALIGLLLVCAAVGILLTIQTTTAAVPTAPAESPPTTTARTAAPATPPVPATPAPPTAPPSTTTTTTTTITLHRGDTLWALARHHGTTVADLQRLNQLGHATLIRAGAQLRVPASATRADHTQPAPVRTTTTTKTRTHQATSIHQATASGHPATSKPARPAAHATPTAGQGAARQAAATVFGPEYGCAANIITRESGWNVHATNPRSGAYGLAQALPGTKMATAGPRWRDDPATQLTWMRTYVTARYGSVCGAWAFWQAHAWY
jgi:LysM repeat protein